ncbi:hypothetical protein [Rhodovulum sp. ES.010]|uniref:hypothetical protein n=1 Tax=Rhodovulum sp. ES.010 TaxID=1882821 RepID=UPI0020C9D900|nr:hypothetical protein [Rhodovulum sp. ES.010]
MIRAFAAIDLPGAVRAALVRVQATLPVGRVTPEETLHLTLVFLATCPNPFWRTCILPSRPSTRPRST